MTHQSESGVELRTIRDADLPIFFQFQLDPAANRMAAFTHKDPTDRDAFMTHWARIRGDATVTIRTVVFDASIVGSVASFVDQQLGRPEVTYWIGKEYWGKGIATAALKQFLMIQTSRPLYARAAKDNIASIRVLEKCGFLVAGYDRGYANARAQEIEEVIMVLD